MPKIFRATIVVCLLAVACGPVPAAQEAQSPATPPPTAAPAPTTTTNRAVANTYRYTMQVDLADLGTIRYRGAVDEDRGLAEIRFSLAEIAEIASLVVGDVPEATSEMIVVQGPDGVAVKGLSSLVVGYGAIEPDPEVWYSYDLFEGGAADAFFLSATPTADDVWELLAVEPESTVANGNPVQRAELTRRQLEPHRDSNTFLYFADSFFTAALVETTEDDQGRLAHVLFHIKDGDDETKITIDVTERGRPVDIAEPVEVQSWDLPPEPEPPVSPSTTMPVDIVELKPSLQAGSEGVIFRLSINGGWELTDAPTQQVSLLEDGRLVRVTDTSVFASTDDFTAMQLSPAGVDRVVTLLQDSGILEAPRGMLNEGDGVSPTDMSVTLWSEYRPLVSMDRYGQSDGYSDEQLLWRAKFGEVVEAIADPSWLGDDIIEPWSPWMPETLAVLAGEVSPRSGLPPGAPFAEWPHKLDITAMATGTTSNAYGEEELVICLSGDEVGPVWELLTGVNNAYLRVDDGQEWELTVMLRWPGYRRSSDHC